MQWQHIHFTADQSSWIDYGLTATTYDVGADGTFEAAVIAPVESAPQSLQVSGIRQQCSRQFEIKKTKNQF